MRVFVTVGNAQQSFDRMLRAVDGALARHPGAFVGTCQHGPSAVRPRGLRTVASLSRTEFDAEVEAAEVVVTHAGVGSVQTALRAGHVPIVMARRSGLGEIVDDHQLQLVQEFARTERVLVAGDEDDLAALLGAFARGERRGRTAGERAQADALASLRAALGEGRAERRSVGRLRRAYLALLGAFAPPLATLRERPPRSS